MQMVLTWDKGIFVKHSGALAVGISEMGLRGAQAQSQGGQGSYPRACLYRGRYQRIPCPN